MKCHISDQTTDILLNTNSYITFHDMDELGDITVDQIAAVSTEEKDRTLSLIKTELTFITW